MERGKTSSSALIYCSHGSSPPSLPPFICPFVQLLSSSSLYSFMWLILFSFAPRLFLLCLTPIPCFCLTETQKRRSAADFTLTWLHPSILPSSLCAAAGKTLRRSSVRVHEAQIFMRPLCSEQQQMMSGNNRHPVSMATSAIHSPPFSTQAGWEGWEKATGSRSLPPYSKWGRGWLWWCWMRKKRTTIFCDCFLIYITHISTLAPPVLADPSSALFLVDASLPSQPCTGTFKLLTIMQLHNDS